MTDEKDFLDAILAKPGDPELRLAYADWLEEQGDRRSEFLRLQLELSQVAEKDKKERHRLKKRLRELRDGLDESWLITIDQAPVEGCFSKPAKSRSPEYVDFAFECPKRWEDLKPTAEDHFTRYCDSCKKRVFYCSTIEMAQRHAGRGHCIAVNSSLARKQGDVPFNPPRDRVQSATMTAGMVSATMTLGIMAPPAPRFRLGQQVRIHSGQYQGSQGLIRSLCLGQLQARVRIESVGNVDVDFEEMEPADWSEY